MFVSFIAVFGTLSASASPAKGVPLYAGLGHHHRHITTSSPLAQKYFDQGLAFMNGFNHAEAIRSFTYAAKLDPKCAMAYWGIAVAYGPNINYPFVDPVHAKGAWDALTKARSLENHATRVERALIGALSKRYANPQPTDRSPLDKAYADAMRQVWHKFPRDTDVGVLFAESLMDLRPWDLWSLDGKPRDITPEIERTLEKVIRLDPYQPQALHLYVHTMEASPTPEKALFAANRLRSLQPGLGHMVHMPSHIDIRLGHWIQAETANVKAIAVDAAYRRKQPNQDFYRAYMTHNYHMLAFAAMMRGEGERAIQTMDKGIAIIPADWAKANAPFVDLYMSMPLEVRKRFGRWQQVLDAPDFPDYFPCARALRHADRGIAYAALGKVDEAKQEQALYEGAVKAIPAGTMLGNNQAGTIFTVERHLLAGEVLLADKKMDGALAELRQAVQAEDQVSYDEPPDWIQPTRHTLGAALIEAGKYAEAADVYRKDLKNHPNNGWALYGLAQACRGLGKDTEAGRYNAAFARAWRNADLKIDSSCLCVPKAG